MSTAEAARRFLDAFGVPPAYIPPGVDSQLDLYRSLLAGRRVLVVLDNARDAEQVRPLLPGAPGCVVIVTSSKRLASLVAVEGARLLTLDLLPTAESRQLFAYHVGGDRVAAEPEAVDRIIERCGHLPLALAVTAARAVTQPAFPLAAIATELDQARRGLDAFTGTDPATDARATFAWSYRALQPDAAALFRLLGLHPGPDIAVPAAAALPGLPVQRARPLLAELTGAHLVIEHAPDRYHLHDLLRSYASELADADDPEAHRRAAARRLLDHHVHTAHAAAMLVNPQLDPIALPLKPATAQPEPVADDKQAWAWFDAERYNVLAAVKLAETEGFDRHAWQLAWGLFSALIRRGYWHDVHACQTVALAAASRLGGHAAQAVAHRMLSAALLQLGRFDESAEHLTRALELYAGLGDVVGQAHVHGALDRLYGRQGRHAEGLPHARTALELYESAGHRVGEADSLNGVA